MRLFVALSLPAVARGALAEWAAEVAPAGVRVLPASRLHVTLAFLGEGFDPARVAELVVPLAAPVGTLAARGALWLPPRRPRVLCAALAPSPSLSALRERVARALSDGAGWQPERRAFRPHVTVGRVRRGAAVGGAAVAAVPTPPVLLMEPEALVLYRSRAGIYEPLASAPLG